MTRTSRTTQPLPSVPPGRVTLRDVAAQVGISAAAVSSVLAGRTTGAGAVSAATRARIQAMANALGYRPNLTGRGMRQGRSFLAGVLLSEVNTEHLTDLLRGMQDVLAPAHIAPLVFTHRNEGEEAANLQLCLEHGVDGLLVNPWVSRGAPPPTALYGELAARLPLVEVYGRYLHPAPTVTLDMAMAARLAVAHLAQRGHRRIALLTHDRYASGRQRGKVHFDAWEHACGYRVAMTAAGLTPTILTFPLPDEILRAGWLDAGEQALHAHRAELARHTALMCYSDWEALGVLRGAPSVGMAVPADLAVIGSGDLLAGLAVAPALSTLRLPAHATGQAAARLLLQRLAGATPDSVVLPPELLARASTDDQQSPKA